jgi:hypothetical protein
MSKPALFLSKNFKTSLLVAAILKSYSAATCLMNFTQPKSPSTDVIGRYSGGKFITDISLPENLVFSGLQN